MLKTLNETQQSLLVQLKEIEGWLKDGCASTEEREALQQEREEIQQQVKPLYPISIIHKSPIGNGQLFFSRDNLRVLTFLVLNS